MAMPRIRTRSLPDLRCLPEDCGSPYTIRQILNSIENNMLEMKDEMRKLKKQNEDLSAQNKRLKFQLEEALEDVKSFRNSLCWLQALYETAESKVENLEDDHQNLEDLLLENSDEIRKFKKKVNYGFRTLGFLIKDIDDEIIQNNLLLEGLVQVKGENLIEVVQRIGVQIQYPISHSEISACIRSTTNQVLVKFASKETRDQFMNKLNHFNNSDHNLKIYPKADIPSKTHIELSKIFGYRLTPQNPNLGHLNNQNKPKQNRRRNNRKRNG